MGAAEEIEFLARSKARVEILQELSEHDSLTRRELRQRLDYSRTTIQRNLEALVEEDLLSNSDRSYSLSLGGRYLSEAFLNLLETAEVYHQLEPFLRWVNKSDLDIELRHFDDADLVTPGRGDPYAMINRHVSLIKQADQGVALLPFTGLHASEAAHTQIIEGGAEFELVVESSVAETFQSGPQYRELTEDLREIDRYSVFEYTDPIPYCLCVLGETVQIIAGEGDEPRALIESTDDHVRAWAKQTYQEHKSAASKII